MLVDCGRPDPEQALPEGDRATEALARLAKALGHPARVHIVRFLIDKDVCIAGEIADELPLAASTVSQHLKILRDAGLIRGQIDGPRRNYCVDRAALRTLKALVERL